MCPNGAEFLLEQADNNAVRCNLELSVLCKSRKDAQDPARVNKHSPTPALMPLPPDTASPAPDGDDRVDMVELGRRLWHGKLWIMLAMLLSGATAWVYATQIAVPKYTARAAVALDNRQGAMIDFQSVMPGLSGDPSTVNTEVEVLRSRDLFATLVEDMSLTADPEFNPFLADDIPAPTTQHDINATVDRVAEAITVSNVRSSYVFTISALTTDPDKSAGIANRLAELYIADQLAVKFEAMENATLWLSERVATLRGELETSEARLKNFATKTDLVSVAALEGLNRQIKDTRVRLVELAATRDAQAAQVVTLEARQDAVAPDDPGPARGAPPLARARADLARTGAQHDALRLSLDRLEADYARQSDELVELQQLERETAAVRAIYEDFLKRMQETSVQRGIQQADSRILSTAVAPMHPSEPRRPLILALGLMLGLIAGVGGVLLRETMQTGFRTAQALERETGLTVIGQVPKIPARKRKALVSYLVDKPTSAAAEAVRDLRTSLMLSNLDRPPQVILSTSALSQEGKTTTAIALAQNFSGLGKRVLLIEGDLRRRVFPDYFDIDPTRGLLSVLSGAARLGDVVRKIDPLGVDVLPGGHSAINAADVFSSDRFASFVQDLRQSYDVILIDTPPVLLVPDARIIAQEVDAVLITVRWNATSRAQIREAVRQFALSGITVTGAVLNQIDPKGMKRYGYGGRNGAYAAYAHTTYDRD